jgi:hypothetical protein
MSGKKISLICLVLLIAISLPQPADSYPVSASITETTAGNMPNSSASIAGDNQGPRKKIRKKRRTILNRKTKMKSGKHCPSF